MSNELSYILSNISNNINAVGNEVSRVQENMEVLYKQAAETQGQVGAVEERLEALINEFLVFLDSDRKSKSLQLAETRIVKVRQELETKYGHYKEVRHVSQSIMQTLDSGVLNEKVLQSVSDELMLKTPRYWLAAVAVALSAWINDDKNLAETALQEAFRRDDYKTSLFFTLICNRLSRPEATVQWVNRYFQHQDPGALDREFVVILNAIAGGVFPAQSASIAVEHVNNWIQILGNEKQVEENVVNRWIDRLETMTGSAADQEFPHMERAVTNFDEFESYLEMTSTFEEHVAFIKKVFTANISKKSLIQKVDELLLRLTEDFDDEELPLRKEERHLNLIIQEAGDEAIAKKKFQTETQIYDENVDILQILTNTSMNPDGASVDVLTQRLSLTLSKSYILKAHQKFVHNTRGMRPAQAELKIDTFKGVSNSGENEKELLAGFKAHMDKELQRSLATAKILPWQWIVAGGAGLFLILALSAKSIFFGIVAVGLGIWFYTMYKGLADQKANIQRNFKARIDTGVVLIRGVCAELVDFFSTIEKCNPNAEKFSQTLSSFVPENSISSEHRKIVA